MKFNSLLTTGAAQGGIFVDSPRKILAPYLNGLIQWAKEQMDDILQNRRNESGDSSI